MNKQIHKSNSTLPPVTIADFIEAHASSLRLGQGSKIEFASQEEEVELKNLLLAIFNDSEQELTPLVDMASFRTTQSYKIAEDSHQNFQNGIVLKSTDTNIEFAISVLDFINLFAATPLPEQFPYKKGVARAAH